MKIAAIQMRSGIRIADNIQSADELIRKAAQQGARFIATPEMTHVLNQSSKSLFETISYESDDFGVAAFSALAKELSVFLLIGSLAIKTGDRRAANRSFLFGPDGIILARYDKIHLFDVVVSDQETWTESRIYDKGDKAVLADIGGMNLGFSICYDIRFAKLYRAYAQSGAHIISVPAAFTRPTGQAHWETLLRARAIETGSYIIAPAQGGLHEDGRKTWGRSMIIGPWGDIISQLDHDAPAVLMGEADIEAVMSARKKIPAWRIDPDFSMTHAPACTGQIDD